jgi:hypothetical protein
MQDLLNLIRWMLLGLFRSKSSLEADILALRHQLNVLRRTSPRLNATPLELEDERVWRLPAVENDHSSRFRL